MILIESLWTSYRVMRRDKVLFLLAFLPFLIGVVFYSWLWLGPFGFLLEQGRWWIEQQISSTGWSTLLYYFFMGILGIGFWFLLNWTFVLAVSLVACPFNDLISQRVERAMRGQNPAGEGDLPKFLWRRLGKVISNEIKKVLFIFFLSLVAFALSWIPVLLPVSMILSGLLVAASFLDYSWSRHNMKLKDCLYDIKSSLIVYGISGGFFLALLSIPLINVLILSYGTVYYTVLFSRRR